MIHPIVAFRKKIRALHPMRLLESRIVLFLLIGIALVGLYQFGQLFFKRYDTEQEIRKFQGDITKLEDQQNKIEELQKFLGSSFFAEQEARMRLGLQKPGEKAVVVHDLKQEGTEETTSPSEKPVKAAPKTSREGNIQNGVDGQKIANVSSEDKKNNPIQWWDYFFASRNEGLE